MVFTKSKKKFVKRKGKGTKAIIKRRPASMGIKSTVNAGLGFPVKMLVKQKYTETVFMNSNLGTLANYLFSLNGLYDPNFTGAGHQPMYFDQYMAIYNHFTVIGAKITVTFVPYETNTTPLRVALWQNDDTTVTPTTMDSIQEQSIATASILGSGGDAKVTKSFKWSPKKVFGGSLLANSLFRGNSGANPTEQSYGVISVQSANVTDTNSCSALVHIEYITVYSELKDIVGS